MSLLRTQIAGALHRPARLLLTGLAVAVAAFVVFATVLAQQALERTVLDNLHGTPAAADIVIHSDPEVSVQAAALPEVRRVPGVAEAQARTTAYLKLRRPAGISLAMSADPGKGELALVHVVKGSYPHAPGEMALTERSANRLGVGIGDTVSVLSGPQQDRPVALKITGFAVAPDAAGGMDGEQAYAPDTTVFRVGGPDVSVSQIDVRLTPGADAQQTRTALETAAGPDARTKAHVFSGDRTRDQERQKATGQYDALFTIVSVFETVAVIAAALVATSTFRIVFAQRMRQLALLRAVGADRKPLVRALAAEGALTGAVAGACGVALATAVGNGLPAVLGFFGTHVSMPGLPLGPALAVVLGAVAMTVIAVLSPAANAARVSPLEALRSASTSAGQHGIGRSRALWGGLLVAVSLLLAAIATAKLPKAGQEDIPKSVLFLIVFSGGLAYFALVALGPVLVRPILRVVGWPLRMSGPLGRLAVGGVGGATRRAAAVSVVVGLGVTMIGVVLVGATYEQKTVDRMVTALAPSDFWLNSSEGKPLPEAMVRNAGRAKTLTRVLPERTAAVGIGTRPQENTAVDLDLRKLPTWHQLRTTSGSVQDIAPGGVALLQGTAHRARTAVGDTITLTYGTHSAKVKVVAILDAAPLGADILTTPADLNRLGVPAGPTGLLADAAAAGEQGRNNAVRTLSAVIGTKDQAYLTVLADQRDSLLSGLAYTVGGSLALTGLTVVIAITGVGATTALSVVERVREAGLLRAVGLTRRGLSGAMTLEAALYGAIGATMGLLLAVPYSWLILKALGASGPVEFPVIQLLGLVMALTALTALAGALPARRAARVSPVAALAVDG